MRVIGYLENETAARTLSDFLFVQGVENQIERDGTHGWALWIHSEDQMDQAKGWLADFRKDPASAQFKQAAAKAEKLRQQKDKEDLAYAKKVKPRAEVLRSLRGRPYGVLTLTLIALCVLVFVFQNLGNNGRWVALLPLSNQTGGLAAVMHGEIWRLVTPIFLHFGIVHILFNMIWLWDLGGMIESRQGAAQLGALVLGVAVASNLAQYGVNVYSHAGGDIFGGMSGVVYGLLGYVWMRGKFDAGSGLFLHQSTVTMMLVWAVVCLTGFVGHIANTVHFVGLGVGMAWGYLISLRYR